MATNPLRKIVLDEQLGSFRFHLYDTGAAYLNWTDRDKLAMSITQANELHSTGHLRKLFLLLEDEDASKVAGFFSTGIKLEFSQGKLEALRYILDSSLSDSAKLAYVISYLANKVKLSQSVLEEIFAKRPEPLLELNSSVSNQVSATSIRNSIFPGYFNPQDQLKSEEEFVKFNKLSAFLASISPMTYAQFKEAHKDENFIPHRHSGVSAEVFKPVGEELVNELYPREYVRYASYFGGTVSSELRSWAKSRFDEGVETFTEAQDRGKVKFAGTQENHNWYPTIKLLTVKEAEVFQELLKRPNGLSSIFSGVDKHAASIFAYYFVMGGEEKLMELALHISHNAVPDPYRSMWGAPQANLRWMNPFSSQSGKTVKLTPYVKALQEENFMAYPLDWLLATQ